MPRPIALWSTPRSVSTAFDKMMRSRGDHRVFTEPFSVPYYFGPDRCSDRFEDSLGDEGVPEASYEAVWQEVLGSADDQPVFVKEMPHHLGPDLEPAVLEHFESSFLIRDPARSVPSCLAMWPDATDEELGYEAQRRAFELACADGEPPAVIDAADLRQDPAHIVGRWCEELDVAFDPETLTWEPGMPADWELWSGWFQRAAASTGFLPPDPGDPPEVSDEVRVRIERCRAHYDHLYEHRLR